MAKDTIKITRDKLVREVSKASSLSIAKTKSVFNNIEDVVTDHLSEADQNTDVVIRVFDGLNIMSTYQPESTHNFLGKDIVVSQRIKPKAVLTRHYVDRINSQYY